MAITMHPARGLELARRWVYFIVLRLPMLLVVKFAFFSAIFHLPFAMVHTFTARKRSTDELLRRSWAIPFEVAAFSVLIPVGVSLAELRGSAGFDFGRSVASFVEGLVYCMGIGFVASLPFVGLGWLLTAVVTVLAPDSERARL